MHAIHGPDLRQTVLQGDLVLPVGFVSKIFDIEHNHDVLMAQVRGTSLSLKALARALKKYGWDEAGERLNALAYLGVVVPQSMQEAFVAQMLETADTGGAELSAMVQAMLIEGHGYDEDDDDEGPKHAFRRVLRLLWRDKPIHQVLSIIDHTLMVLGRVPTVQSHANIRAKEFVALAGMDTKFEPILSDVLSVAHMSMLDIDINNEFFECATVGLSLCASQKRSVLSPLGPWENILGHYPDLDVKELLGSDGLLSHFGVLTWAGDAWMRFARQTVNMSAQNGAYWRALLMGDVSTPISKRVLEDIFQPFIAPHKDIFHSMEDFSFMGKDKDVLVQLLSSNSPSRVLFVGVNGSGRRACLAHVAQALNKDVLKPSCDGATDVEDWWRGVIDCQNNGKVMQGHILTVDADQKFEGHGLTFVRNRRPKMALHEVWLIPTLKDFPPSLVEMFDFIIHMPTMPMNKRKELARHLLSEELSEHVAQSATLPSEMGLVLDYATRLNTTDWSVLSNILLTFQRARLGEHSSSALPVELYPPSTLEKGFEAVVGEERNVEKANVLIQALKQPEAYERMGVPAPKGMILLGPPGTGKTHLARAMAKEAGVNLLLADAAGMAQTPELIPDVFNEARRQAPCILFIDEIDAVGARTGDDVNPARQAILNRLLTELDGFRSLEGVFVIGATHRGDLLDPALVRAGRLGHMLTFDLPSTESREKIWKHYAQKMPLSDLIDWKRVARISTGMSPAEIQACTSQAGMQALRDNSDRVGTTHFLKAIDEEMWGGYNDRMPLHQSELYRVCVHEAGHALLAWFHHMEMDKVCVRPRHDGSLGFVRFLPEEGMQSKMQLDMWAMMSMAFGGAVAEKIVLGSHSTGAESDLQRIWSLARTAVRSSGMHPDLPAGLGITMFSTPTNKMFEKAEGLETEWIEKAHQHASTWLEENKHVIVELAALLQARREIDGDEASSFIKERLGDQQCQVAKNVPLCEAARALTSHLPSN